MNANDAPGPAGDCGKPKIPRRRRRLPSLAILRIVDELLPNESHPLANAPAESRAAGRLRLIAAVLARLARRGRGSA